VVILKTSDYQNKIQNFAIDNGLIKINSDPTIKFHTKLKQTINKISIIPKENKMKLKSINPRAPKIRGLIKLHKDKQPIRPIVNMRNSPTYQVGKFLNKYLNDLIQLPYTYNIKNSIHLINDINNIHTKEHTRMCSFDIIDMYTNISNELIIEGIKLALTIKENDATQTRHIIQLANIILMQNYFEADNKFYIQNNGIAMGAPTSSLLSEIVLQNWEHNIIRVLIENQIIGYFRYVDDIMIIYDEHNRYK
jgi:hypothetical protein